MRQQLQESGLLQHMDRMFIDAENTLKAAVAAAAVAAPACSSSSTAAQQAADQVQLAIILVNELVGVYHGACVTSFPGEEKGFSMEAALPAAPAAMRMILTTFRTCSRLQQLTGRSDSSAPLLVLSGDAGFQVDCNDTLRMLYWVGCDLAGTMHTQNVAGALQLLPGAHELLLCPELVPCLAITVLVGLFGLNTGTQEAAGRGSGSSSRVAAAAGSSRSRGALRAQESFQQQQQTPGGPAVPSSKAAGRHQTGSTSSSSSNGRLPNGISLDSLTPLSRGLFGLLGVDQGVLLEVARGASDEWSGQVQCKPENHGCIVSAWCLTPDYQVRAQQLDSQ
jgi:hypothetical protein